MFTKDILKATYLYTKKKCFKQTLFDFNNRKIEILNRSKVISKLVQVFQVEILLSFLSHIFIDNIALLQNYNKYNVFSYKYTIVYFYNVINLAFCKRPLCRILI